MPASWKPSWGRWKCTTRLVPTHFVKATSQKTCFHWSFEFDIQLPFNPDGRYVWNLCGVGPVPKQISTWQHDGEIFTSRLFLQNSNISYWEYHWKSIAFLNSNSKVIQSIQLSKVEGLTATPIWEMEKTGQEEHLGKIIHKDNWNTIR